MSVNNCTKVRAVINSVKLPNLAVITWASSCLPMLSQKSSLSTSIADSWTTDGGSEGFAMQFCVSLAVLAWLLKIALQCPKSGSVNCLANQHIQHWLAAASVHGHEWIWQRGTGSSNGRMRILAIFSLPKSDVFRRGNMPCCRWSVAAVSVGKYIDVTVSNEIVQVQHESCNGVACLTLPFKACAWGWKTLSVTQRTLYSPLKMRRNGIL